MIKNTQLENTEAYLLHWSGMKILCWKETISLMQGETDDALTIVFLLQKLAGGLEIL